ncbi:GNAT family N-acetyltransferase [Psychromarinibacter sp. S121]|uniref:GNAT family N-acetyltransferase n=1 Tax=Psychromarinibacter sp. S121 TaxID=3415127 RepID=UPI003C7A6B51
MSLSIRHESAGDEQAIHDLTVVAFTPVPQSDGAEAPIVAALRESGALTISLVAVDGPEIVGHIAFSPVTAGTDAEGWYGLGPVSVHPDRQGQGIGGAMIEEGLALLRGRDAKGCVLVGDPAYYSRFGFRSDGAVSYGDVPVKYVQWLALREVTPSGELRYDPAFG